MSLQMQLRKSSKTGETIQDLLPSSKSQDIFSLRRIFICSLSSFVFYAKPYEGQAAKDALSIVWPDDFRCCSEHKCLTNTCVSITRTVEYEKKAFGRVCVRVREYGIEHK